MLKVGFKVVAIGVFLFMLKFFWFQENNLKSNVTVAKKNELLQIKQKDTVYVKKDVLVKRYFKYLTIAN